MKLNCEAGGKLYIIYYHEYGLYILDITYISCITYYIGWDLLVEASLKPV